MEECRERQVLADEKRDEADRDWQELVDFMAATAQNVASDLNLDDSDSGRLWQTFVESIETLRSQTTPCPWVPQNPVDKTLSLAAAGKSEWAPIWRSKTVRDALERSWRLSVFPDLEPVEFPPESKVALTLHLWEARSSRWFVRWERTAQRDLVCFRPETKPSSGFLLNHPRTNSPVPLDERRGVVSRLLSRETVLNLFHAKRSVACNPSDLI